MVRRVWWWAALVACGDNGGASDGGDETGTTAETSTETSTQADGDGDGFAAPIDCDDSDAAVSPDADEICDGRDNDCDGTTDLDPVAPLWHLDADGDGFGDPADAIGDCYELAGRVADGTDCDDAEADVHPGATEWCNDRDDDCDPATAEDGVVSVNGRLTYATVQAAVDAAVNGSVIDLCPGTYLEPLIATKGLVWRGHGGRDAVFLDGAGFAPTLRVTDGSLTRIEGVTLQNGIGDQGGCLSVSSGDLELVDARLQACAASAGGGLYFVGDQVFGERTEIRDNTATLEGGGVWGGFNAEFRLTDCQISGNSASTGGGAFGLQSTDFLLDGTSVTGNAVDGFGGGLFLRQGSTASLDGGALTGNVASQGGGVLLDASSFTAITADLGVGGTENSPEDVFVVGVGGFGVAGVGGMSCTGLGC